MVRVGSPHVMVLSLFNDSTGVTQSVYISPLCTALGLLAIVFRASTEMTRNNCPPSLAMSAPLSGTPVYCVRAACGLRKIMQLSPSVYPAVSFLKMFVINTESLTMVGSLVGYAVLRAVTQQHVSCTHSMWVCVVGGILCVLCNIETAKPQTPFSYPVAVAMRCSRSSRALIHEE